MTDPEDLRQQADISRLLLYYLSAPLVEGSRLRGVLPAPGAVRIAVRTGEDEGDAPVLYEIPHDSVAPYWIPGILRTVLTRRGVHAGGGPDEVMGMAVVRLRPEEITPDPEPEQGLALTVLRALSDNPYDDTVSPFLIGFLLREHGLLRLYVRHSDHPDIVGVDLRLTAASTALIASVPSLVGQAQYQRPSPDDPHCALVVDLTDW
ncbi:hypothetical protein [Streptomyces sp. NPDC054829]